MFSGEELLAFMQMATYCSVNDYEARLLVERTGRASNPSPPKWRRSSLRLVHQGSQIHTAGEQNRRALCQGG